MSDEKTKRAWQEVDETAHQSARLFGNMGKQIIYICRALVDLRNRLASLERTDEIRREREEY
jgi:hypothetical protein